MEELEKISNEGKLKIFNQLITHAETMAKGKALQMGFSDKEYAESKLVAICFLDAVKVAIKNITKPNNKSNPKIKEDEKV